MSDAPRGQLVQRADLAAGECRTHEVGPVHVDVLDAAQQEQMHGVAVFAQGGERVGVAQ